MDTREFLAAGGASLGIEFGSTRIKAVLTGEHYEPLASGSHQWENRFEEGIWTYSLEDIEKGLQSCYAALVRDVKEKYDIVPQKLASIGISAMMHGYLALDADGGFLVPFRTWRNTMTDEAARKLTELLHFNIPQRWSIAHLYQAILNQEEHVERLSFLTTLAGYVHWRMTGKKVLGVGDASGMFPVDSQICDYHEGMLGKLEELLSAQGYSWRLRDVLPKVLSAGEDAGFLTEEGAVLLDPTGNLQAGIPLCPPEGDAGTGMVATNSVGVRTGNVSAGTSVFAMVVMEEQMRAVHTEIDLVATPDGKPVAMVHCNNCTSDINAWAGLFREFAQCFGMNIDTSELFTKLFQKAEEGDADCGGLLSYNYFSGEGVTSFDEGRPLFVRRAEDSFTLANFMRMHLYSALATLKVGLDLLHQENVRIDKMYGHGGYFTTKGVGQRIMAAAMNTPVSVMETAGEGGAWGIALLAAYHVKREKGEALSDFLNRWVFVGEQGEEFAPVPEDVKGFEEFMVRYRKGLAVESAAVEWI